MCFLEASAKGLHNAQGTESEFRSGQKRAVSIDKHFPSKATSCSYI
jgi:hypothetical protein